MSGNRPNRDEIKKHHHHHCSRAAQSANSLIDILWSGKHSMHPHCSGQNSGWEKRPKEERGRGGKKRWRGLQLFLYNGILTRGQQTWGNGSVNSQSKYTVKYIWLLLCPNIRSSGWEFWKCFGSSEVLHGWTTVCRVSYESHSKPSPIIQSSFWSLGVL